MSVTIVNETGGVLGTKILDDEGNDLSSILFVEGLNLNLENVDSIVKATIKIGLVKTKTKTGEIEWVTRNPISGKIEKISSIQFEKDYIIFSPRGAEIYSSDDNGRLVLMKPINDGRVYKFLAAE